jgi:hypothetical protein
MSMTTHKFTITVKIPPMYNTLLVIFKLITYFIQHLCCHHTPTVNAYFERTLMCWTHSWLEMRGTEMETAFSLTSKHFTLQNNKTGIQQNEVPGPSNEAFSAKMFNYIYL